ncbi:DUF1015 domain-containing protein [Echinicola sp. 20G]|uniref:DUF1015 domain-containing protein n=1 Tax=Echinicola sp. 20G TaxID=2781961 RepID=UPI001910DE82|nr:DUF1015 domain-containing protein [Echinicola sp. 20G]
MAEILPLKAWRYHPRYTDSLEQLTSPLFDVVSPAQLDLLYTNPINSIHFTLPNKENTVQETSSLLKNWKDQGVIIQDQLPGIYVYYQYFRLPGSSKEHCRKGFVIHIRAYDWDEKQILRHENTIAHSVTERVNLLNATEIQSSPTHGLYEDASFSLEGYMDESIKNPIYDLKDYQGVREVLSVITDATIIARFISFMKDKKIILADGHHRLQAAISYKHQCAKSNKNHNGNEGYNYHMMYLTNSRSNNLKILPTHRLVKKLGSSRETVLDKSKKYFDIETIYDADEIDPMNLQQKWSFILLFREQAYLIVLKENKINEFNSALPEAVKNLDLSVLHYFFVDKVLGIPFRKQRFDDNLLYEKNLLRCQHKVADKEVDLAIITREILMEEVMAVCHSGHTLPQKSTYFYPKTLSGLLFGSVKSEEFNYPYSKYFNP